jgi:hypothetical protein
LLSAGDEDGHIVDRAEILERLDDGLGDEFLWLQIDRRAAVREPSRQSPGPIAAIFAPPIERTSSYILKKRSKNAVTPLGEVKMIHS